MVFVKGGIMDLKNKCYKAKHYKQNDCHGSKALKEYIKNTIDDVIHTNWLSDIIKTLLITIGSIILCSYVLKNFSKGELQGEDLKEYLNQITCNALNIHYNAYDNNNIQFDISLNYYSDTLLSENMVLAAIGDYKSENYTPNNSHKDYNGRYIVLFERKKPNFIHYLTGVKPRYEIAFMRFIESDDILPSTIFDYDYIVGDYDKNGETDLIISLYSLMADRVLTTYIFLTKINNQWEIVELPFEKIFNKKDDSFFYSDDTESYYLSIEDWLMFESPYNKGVKNNDKIYSFSRGGDITVIDNRKNSKSGVLVRIVAIGYGESLLNPGQQVYVYFDYNKGELKLNESWNNGEPLVITGDDWKNFDVNKYW